MLCALLEPLCIFPLNCVKLLTGPSFSDLPNEMDAKQTNHNFVFFFFFLTLLLVSFFIHIKKIISIFNNESLANVNTHMPHHVALASSNVGPADDLRPP